MNSRWLFAFRSTGLASVLVLTLSAVGAAQSPRSGASASRPQSAAKAAAQLRRPENPPDPSKKEIKVFARVADRLHTTPQALNNAYWVAYQANPNLKRGQFIAANMVAWNHHGRNPAITTQAILNGLASGKSIGQTLQSLGQSAKEAKKAIAVAKRDARRKSEKVAA